MLNHDAATALQQLLKGMGVRGSRVLNEPRQVACGAPDPVVEHDGVAIGHVASTDITIPLDQAAATGAVGTLPPWSGQCDSGQPSGVPLVPGGSTVGQVCLGHPDSHGAIRIERRRLTG